MKLWPSQRAVRGPWTEEPSCLFRLPPIGCAFWGGGFFGFKFLGEGGYFEGLGGRVSEYANEPFSTSHFQILKLLKGEGEISGLKSSMVGFLPLPPPLSPPQPHTLHSFRQNQITGDGFLRSSSTRQEFRYLNIQVHKRMLLELPFSFQTCFNFLH